MLAVLLFNFYNPTKWFNIIKHYVYKLFCILKYKKDLLDIYHRNVNIRDRFHFLKVPEVINHIWSLQSK